MRDEISRTKSRSCSIQHNAQACSRASVTSTSPMAVRSALVSPAVGSSSNQHRRFGREHHRELETPLHAMAQITGRSVMLSARPVARRIASAGSGSLQLSASRELRRAISL